MTGRQRRARRFGLLPLFPALALVTLLALAGCGNDEDPAKAAGGAASSSGSASTSATPAFDPCKGLPAAPVSDALGQGLKVDRGKGGERCALIPTRKGGPTFQLNYLWFPDGLEAAFETIDVPAGEVSKPKVAGADASRLIVQRTPDAYYITGFVQDGDLIQSANGLALAPYDAPRMRRAMLVLLEEMSANAPS